MLGSCHGLGAVGVGEGFVAGKWCPHALVEHYDVCEERMGLQKVL